MAIDHARLRLMGQKFGKFLDTSMRQSGMILDSVVGLDGRGDIAVTLMPEGAGIDLPQGATREIRLPYRDHQGEIAEVFAGFGVQAAFLWGEAWTFPPGDDEAAKRHLGEGLMPSEHPNRQEIVFLAANWPRGGVGWLSTWRIVRTPTQAYLRPQHTFADDPGSSLVVLSTWLDDVLPNPQPGE